jgi:putative phosphoesterase
MRYGIFSDVHGNLEAFEEVLKFYKKEKIDKYIFLGDIVGYGANPFECIALLKNINPVCIAGNHDFAVIDKFSINYFNDYAKEAILWTKNRIGPQDALFLNNFILQFEENDFICVHGSLNNPGKFNYILGFKEARTNFSLLAKQLLFIGHTHRAEAYSFGNDGISRIASHKIKLTLGKKYIINVGSVGQPRDHNRLASLCIYDSKTNMVFFRRLEYNIQKAANKILEAGLPDILAERLYDGR